MLAQFQLDGNLASEVSPPFRIIRGRKVVTCIKRNVALLSGKPPLPKANRPFDGVTHHFAFGASPQAERRLSFRASTKVREPEEGE
jgi:hypothetical protein